MEYLNAQAIQSKQQDVRGYVPVIYENNGQASDIYSSLLKDRTVFIGDEVCDYMANSVIAQILHLLNSNKDDIKIYINTPGGSVTAGLAIYDIIQLAKSQGVTVKTYCIGICASMGSVLLCSGSKGYRSILPNSHVMIHQVSGGAMGTASDVERTVGFMYNLKGRLNSIIAKHTGKTSKEVEADSDRDNYLSAQEAVDYGLVDTITEI